MSLPKTSILEKLKAFDNEAPSNIIKVKMHEIAGEIRAKESKDISKFFGKGFQELWRGMLSISILPRASQLKTKVSRPKTISHSFSQTGDYMRLAEIEYIAQNLKIAENLQLTAQEINSLRLQIMTDLEHDAVLDWLTPAAKTVPAPAA